MIGVGDPEDKGSTIYRNVGDYLVADTAQHLRRVDRPVPLWSPETLHSALTFPEQV
jgi:hypothetical protein